MEKEQNHVDHPLSEHLLILNVFVVLHVYNGYKTALAISTVHSIVFHILQNVPKTVVTDQSFDL